MGKVLELLERCEQRRALEAQPERAAWDKHPSCHGEIIGLGPVTHDARQSCRRLCRPKLSAGEGGGRPPAPNGGEFRFVCPRARRVVLPFVLEISSLGASQGPLPARMDPRGSSFARPAAAFTRNCAVECSQPY